MVLSVSIILLNLSCKKNQNNISTTEAENSTYGIECKDILPIYVSQISPSDTISLRVRKYLLISEDSLFNSKVKDSSLTDFEIYNMFLMKWETDQDWYMNAFLYSRYRQSAFSMKEFEPCDIKSWRASDKENCRRFWTEFFEKNK